jgi:hypothetical protein
LKRCRVDKKVMDFKGLKLIILLLLANLGSQAKGGERFEFYNGVRSLGMGGAAVAVVNDETAMLVNPAALGKLRDYIITVADPELEGSTNATTLAQDKPLNMFEPQTVLDKMNDPGNLGDRFHLKAQVFPSLVVPNFGFGVHAKYVIDAKVDSTGTNFELDYTNDFAAVAAFNFRMWDGIIKLGASGRAINRVEVHRTDIPANSTGLSIDAIGSEGFGVASDVGLVLTAPIVLLPALAAVWRDAGGTSYNLKDGMFTGAVTIPTHTTQTVDVGLAIFPIFSNRTRGTLAIEYRDVLTMSDEEDHMRRAHAGFEMNFADAVFLRVGMNQRYWTAGFEFQMLNYQLQGAAYGEEVGTATTPAEDRRYTLKFAFRF